MVTILELFSTLSFLTDYAADYPLASHMKLTFNQPCSPSARTIENLSPFIGRVSHAFADNIVVSCSHFGAAAEGNAGQVRAEKAAGKSSTTAESN